MPLYFEPEWESHAVHWNSLHITRWWVHGYKEHVHSSHKDHKSKASNCPEKVSFSSWDLLYNSFNVRPIVFMVQWATIRKTTLSVEVFSELLNYTWPFYDSRKLVKRCSSPNNGIAKNSRIQHHCSSSAQGPSLQPWIFAGIQHWDVLRTKCSQKASHVHISALCTNFWKFQ